MNERINITDLKLTQKEFLIINEQTEDDILKGKINLERVDSIRRFLVVQNINLLNISYSIQSDNILLKSRLENLIDKLPAYWIKEKVKVYDGRNRIELNQYHIGAYHQMLTIMSLSILLDISKERFEKIVHLIDRDEIKDNLYETFIKFYLPNRKAISEESYRKYLIIPKMNKKILSVFLEFDEVKILKGIKSYLKNKWYSNYKQLSWYDSHIKHPKSFYGYWAFEVAALVKIKCLDDSTFRDNQYYPDRLL